MKIEIQESDIVKAAQEGNEAFVRLFVERTYAAIGGELDAESMQRLTVDQTTLLAYDIVRRELLEGGFVQLIHNGYGPFVFQNPFAKVMRLWGVREFGKLVYEASHLYRECGEELTGDMTDEEFMALYETHEAFDNLDDDFVEMEEEVTATVARYIDEHIENFAEVRK